MHLSEWVYTTHEQPGMDAGVGTVILSTGDKPRGMVQMCAYLGTNTASTEFNFCIMPSREPDAAGTPGTYSPNDADRAFAWGSVSAAFAGTSQALPLVFGPFGTKGVGAGSPGVFAIIPPNSLLIGYPTAATNGTTIVSCVSAELG